MIALDLGSNTLRGVKIDCKSGERLIEFEKIIKTADMLHEKKIINDSAVARVIDAINEAREKLGFAGEKVVAVATAALRLAKNQKDALARIKESTGIDFKVISGEDEAYYVWYALKKALHRLGEERDFMALDIGGGSTEIIFWDSQKLISHSFDVGIVGVAQKYVHKESIAASLGKELGEIVEFISDMKLLGYKPPLFVATAGTPTTVAAVMQGMDYESYDYRKINGFVLKKDDLQLELNRLLKLSTRDREKLVGVGRAELIIAGILMFGYIFEKSGYKECITIDDGLREGVAMVECEKKKRS